MSCSKETVSLSAWVRAARCTRSCVCTSNQEAQEACEARDDSEAKRHGPVFAAVRPATRRTRLRQKRNKQGVSRLWFSSFFRRRVGAPFPDAGAATLCLMTSMSVATFVVYLQTPSTTPRSQAAEEVFHFAKPPAELIEGLIGGLRENRGLIGFCHYLCSTRRHPFRRR